MVAHWVRTAVSPDGYGRTSSRTRAQAREVRILAAVVGGSAAFWVLITGLWLFPGDWRREALAGVIVAVSLLSAALSLRAPRVGGQVLVWGTWLAISATVLNAQTQPSPVTSAYLAVVVLAVRVMGTATGFAVLAASGLVVALGTVLDDRAGLGGRFEYGPSSLFWIYSTVAGVTLVTLAGLRRREVSDEGITDARVAHGLLGLARGMTELGSHGERMQQLCESTKDLLACDSSSVFLLEDGYYRGRFNAGSPPELAALFHQHRVRLDDPLVAAAVTWQRCVVEQGGFERMNQRTAERVGIRAIALAPILDPAGDPVGFLTAEYLENPGRFDERGETLVSAIARMVALQLIVDRKSEPTSAVEDARDEIHRLERLSSIGQLASGVAHDLNNMLTAVVGTCELALEADPPEREATEFRSVSQAALRAGELTKHLLAFARGQSPTPQGADVGEVVQDASGFLRRTLPAGLRLELDVEPGAHPARCPPRDVEQVLLNLVVNARDAMPQGGTIWIRVRTTASFVVLTVSDEGGGIEPEVLPHVYERFFSTKSGALASGLGLSIVKRIAETCGGGVELETTLGEGASFHVRIPRGGRSASEDLPSPDRQKPIQARSALVADGDPAVRRVIAQGLEQLGWEVVTAASAEDALGVLAARDHGVAVVLADARTSGTSGAALLEGIGVRCPETRLVLMSGDSVASMDVPAGVRTLQKPFRLSDLVELLEATDG